MPDNSRALRPLQNLQESLKAKCGHQHVYSRYSDIVSISISISSLHLYLFLHVDLNIDHVSASVYVAISLN